MPKYVLDEKGVLTITSNGDGGICTVGDVLGKVTLVLCIASIILCVALFGFFYYDAPTTKIGSDYCVSKVTAFDYKSQAETVYENGKKELGIEYVTQTVAQQVAYYKETFETMKDSGVTLVSDTRNKVDEFRYKWR